MSTQGHYSVEFLETLLGNLTADCVERKESFSGGSIRENITQAICAFANDFPGHNQPGYIFIGAKDDGSPAGLSVTDNLLLDLAAIRSDGKILPLPAMTVEKYLLKGAEMALITVLPSDMPPVRYEGRVWIRVGPRRAIASAQEERILTEKRRSKDIPFDIYPVPSSTLKDIEQISFEHEFLPRALAPEVLEENDQAMKNSYEERLASCRMIVSPDDPTPTVLGLLVLGKSPQDYLPGANIQFLRIDGVDLSGDVTDEISGQGKISEQIRTARTDTPRRPRRMPWRRRRRQLFPSPCAYMRHKRLCFAKMRKNATLHPIIYTSKKEVAMPTVTGNTISKRTPEEEKMGAGTPYPSVETEEFLTPQEYLERRSKGQINPSDVRYAPPNLATGEMGGFWLKLRQPRYKKFECSPVAVSGEF